VLTRFEGDLRRQKGNSGATLGSDGTRKKQEGGVCEPPEAWFSRGYTSEGWTETSTTQRAQLVQMSVYIHKDVRSKLKVRLFESGGEFSGLVEWLLRDWLRRR
jgi:hypothetical protein